MPILNREMAPYFPPTVVGLEPPPTDRTPVVPVLGLCSLCRHTPCTKADRVDHGDGDKPRLVCADCRPVVAPVHGGEG